MISFRYPEEADRIKITEWIAADPDHREQGISPDFFYGNLSLVIEDEGEPGLYVRIDPEPPNSVRLHIQFGPDKRRSAKAMLRAWPEFMQRVWGGGVSRMVFESKSALLVAFCCRAFGFSNISKTTDYELLREVV